MILEIGLSSRSIYKLNTLPSTLPPPQSSSAPFASAATKCCLMMCCALVATFCLNVPASVCVCECVRLCCAHPPCKVSEGKKRKSIKSKCQIKALWFTTSDFTRSKKIQEKFRITKKKNEKKNWHKIRNVGHFAAPRSRCSLCGNW